MERAQLMLEAEQVHFLADEAARAGVSMSELVRRWIREKMDGATTEADSGDALVGLARGSRNGAKLPVSANHDAELDRIRRQRARPVVKAARGRA